jgi:phenylalanyl-tRNA synthetase beta chain
MQVAQDNSGKFAKIEITNPGLNPRFVLGLIEGIKIGSSPVKIQQRLKLAGMRPINNIVDATNYVMLEMGQPLHAFDYEVLAKRAKGKQVRIITRTAKPGENLTTLDGVEHKLEENTVLVCDEVGSLSIAGVMGGKESEVNDLTCAVLLEGAAWNYINIRKTARAHAVNTEASYRFSRGVHPAMALRGVHRGLELMHAWADGEIAPGLVDAYPLPPKDPRIEITPADVKRWLGIEVSIEQMKSILEGLEFSCNLKTEQCLVVSVPDHRLDIGEGVTGKADIVEEIARIYGYDKIPETRMTDELPPQMGNPELEKEERVRDLLVVKGLQEIVSYRFTNPAHESRRLHSSTSPDDQPYIRITNPIAPDKSVLRHSVLASVLDNAERNSRVHERLALFEIGPTFMVSDTSDLQTRISESPSCLPVCGPFPGGRQRMLVCWASSISRGSSPASWRVCAFLRQGLNPWIIPAFTRGNLRK